MDDRGWTGGSRRFSFLTSAGTLRAAVLSSGRVAIAMPRPKALQLGLRLRVFGRPFTVHTVNTGVPHAVVEVKDVEKVNVGLIGKALRSHPAFRPEGANVDFARFGPSGLIVRTYERGVEDETLACGTGAVASALVAAALGRSRPPVRVRVKSGDVLTVSFETRRHALPREVWLEGPARVVFTGEAAL
jgi:diaminopimelate epimerase